MPYKLKGMKQRWLQVLAGGIALFIAADVLLRVTGSTGFQTLMLFIGSFLVPITFVTYFYGHIRDRDISVPMLANSFVVGGLIGLIAAASIEFSTLKTLNVGALAAVGFIEESAKLIFPLIVYAMWRDRHEADGLLFGVAVGMGFAALETVGYGTTTISQNPGNVDALQNLLVLRGVLSPAGHAAWTGLVCATLWRERERAGSAVLNIKVIAFYLLAVLLHFSWDVVNTENINAVVAIIGALAIAILSLGLLIWRYREARRDLVRLAEEQKSNQPPPATVII